MSSLQAFDVRRARTGQAAEIKCPRATHSDAPRLPVPQYADPPEDEWVRALNQPVINGSVVLLDPGNVAPNCI
jgi:hypothetical protein